LNKSKNKKKKKKGKNSSSNMDDRSNHNGSNPETDSQYTNSLQAIEQKNDKRVIPTQKAECYSQQKSCSKTQIKGSKSPNTIPADFTQE
jgi:hypothetical protein